MNGLMNSTAQAAPSKPIAERISTALRDMETLISNASTMTAILSDLVEIHLGEVREHDGMGMRGTFVDEEAGVRLTWAVYEAEGRIKAIAKSWEAASDLALKLRRTEYVDDPALKLIRRYAAARAEYNAKGAEWVKSKKSAKAGTLEPIEEEIEKRMPPVQTMSGAIACLRECIAEDPFCDKISRRLARASLEYLEREIA